jgi:CBS domain-containing protein
VTTNILDRAASIARKMLDAHVHRIIVTDDDDRPVGVISSMDFVAAVAASQDHAQEYLVPEEATTM